MECVLRPSRSPGSAGNRPTAPRLRPAGLRTAFLRRVLMLGFLLTLPAWWPGPLGAQMQADFPPSPPTSPPPAEWTLRSPDGDVTLQTPDLDLRFYERRSWRPAWTDSAGVTPHAADLLAALRGMETEGLVPANYHLPELERLFTGLTRSGGPRNAEIRNRFEWLMTDAFFSCGRDLAFGRHRPAPEGAARVDLCPDAPLREALEAAVASGRVGETLLDLAPRHAYFRNLRAAWMRYRRIVADGGWPVLPPRPTVVRRGAVGPQVGLIRQRLVVEGDLAQDDAGTPEDAFDAPLEAAVKRFQRRHGLKATGSVDRETRLAMNVPAADRMAQIGLNLERWRWLCRDLGDRHILVNIGDFTLRAASDDAPSLDLRVVVGQTRPEWQTPAFNSRLTQVVFHPFWVVPKSIATREMLPKIKADPEFLKKERLQVVRRLKDEKGLDPLAIDWKRLSEKHFPYTLRQDPGAGNALGRIKFVLTNTPDIYLHDTPSKRFFRRSVRTFSHGCIRVESPLSLVRFLFGEKPATERMIRSGLQQKTPTPVSLPKPVPVYLVYATAWAEKDGSVHFRPDVYRRDAALAALLKAPPPPSALPPGDGPGA